MGFGTEGGLPDLGSRLALLSADKGAMAVWTDTRAGTEASRKQDLVRALVEPATPRELASAADATLRIAGAVAAGAGLALLARSLLGHRARPAAA